MRSSSRATLALFSAAAIGCLAALSPVRAAEPDGLAALIGPAEALRIAIVTRASEKGAKGAAEMKAIATIIPIPRRPCSGSMTTGLTPAPNR